MTTEHHDLSRREFLMRGAAASAAIAAATAASYWLLDKRGPGAGLQESTALADFAVKDFSVPALEGKMMSIVTGTDRKATLQKAIDLLGGIDRFVKPGDRVLLKPNVAFAKAAFLGSTTHPDAVAAAVVLCYKAGAKEVVITDNPINDPENCFMLTGIGKAAAAAGARVIVPKESYFKPYTLEKAKLIRNWPVLLEPLKGIDKVIGIVPVKNHERSGASMAMKGWYGLLGGRRNIFHQDINTIIAELALMIKPTLVILDGTEVMMTNGPTGGSTSDLRKVNTMIASCDQVAADAFGSTLLDLKPADLLYLAKAQELGCGKIDFESYKPLRVNI